MLQRSLAAASRVAACAIPSRARAGSLLRAPSTNARRGCAWQLSKMLGVLIAVARGLVPADAIDLALLPSVFVDTPVCPPQALLLAECAYDKYEAQSNTQLRPRACHYTRGFCTAAQHADVRRWQQRVFAHIAAKELRGDEGSLLHWVRDALPAQARKMRQDIELHRLRERAAGGGGGGGGGGAGLDLSVPAAYRRSLQLLREADACGLWPRSSAARAALIDGPRGDSFTMGSMPAGFRQPSANAVFPELLAELRRLELALLPARPPSSTVTVNRHAQFKPHKDSGAGNGQSRSLIVGLGDFSGGQLVVEGSAADIRYKPLEFDGWNERHWTLPFEGERFSVVWFTPMGCEVDRVEDLDPTPRNPHPVLCRVSNDRLVGSHLRQGLGFRLWGLGCWV